MLESTKVEICAREESLLERSRSRSYPKGVPDGPSSSSSWRRQGTTEPSGESPSTISCPTWSTCSTLHAFAALEERTDRRALMRREEL